MRLPFLLLLILIGACPPTARSADLVSKPPRLWSVTLETNGIFHLYADDHQFMRLKSRMGDRRAEYKTLFEGEITKEESALIYKAAVDTLGNFRFVETEAMAMDGNTVSIELEAFQKALRATFSLLESPEKASPGIARIYEVIRKYVPQK